MISYKKKIILNLNKQEHPYFLVTPSIIPFLTSISALFFVTEIVNYFYFWSKPFILVLSFLKRKIKDIILIKFKSSIWTIV